MMNFVAMALLLSYLGAMVVFVPESPVEVVPIGSSDEIQDGSGVQHTARTGKRMGSGEAMDILGMQGGSSDVIQEKAAQFGDSLKEKAAQFGDGLKEKAEEVRDVGESLKGKLEEGLNKAKEEAGIGARSDHVGQDGILSMSKDKASDVDQEKARGVAQDSMSMVKGKASDFHEAAQDVFRQSMNKAKEKAKDVKEGAKDLVQEGITTVEEKASDVKEGAKDLVEGVLSAAKDVEEGAKDLVEGGISAVKEKASGVKEGAKELVQEGMIIGKMEERAQDVKDVMQEGIIGKMEEKAHVVKKRVQEGIIGKNMEEKAHHDVKDAMQRFGSAGGEDDKYGDDGQQQELVVKVHELCSWVRRRSQEEEQQQEEEETPEEGESIIRPAMKKQRRVVHVDYTTTTTTTTTTRSNPYPTKEELEKMGSLQESYGDLMRAAMASIARSSEVLEKMKEMRWHDNNDEDESSAMTSLYREWKERYMNLAESAQGALRAAEDVFKKTKDHLAGADGGSHVDHEDVDDGTVSGNLAGICGRSVSGIIGRSSSMLRSGTTMLTTMNPMKMKMVVPFLYLGIFSMTLGMAMWMTFMSGHVLSSRAGLSHHRQQQQYLATSLERLSPAYLRFTACGLMSCTGMHACMHPWLGSAPSQRRQMASLLASVAASVLNVLLLEPSIRKALDEKLKLEKEEGRGGAELDLGDHNEPTRARFRALDAKLRALHRIASALNLAMLGGLLWHLWYLAHRLVL